MTEIKPVYQTSIDNDSFFSKLNFTSMDESDRDRWIKSGHKVNTLYPAAAYEALKAENEALRKIKEAAENLFSHKDNYHNEQKVIALTNALAKLNNGDRK